MLDTFKQHPSRGRNVKPIVTSRQGFSSGDRVVTTRPHRGFDFGLAATVVSVDPRSGKVTIAPRTTEPPSVFLSIDASSLRYLRPS